MKSLRALEIGTRVLLSLSLLLFGADKFLHFMPLPEAPEAGGQFLGALFGSGYIFPLIGVVFLSSAALFLTHRTVLASFILAPILVNIIAYHMRYDLPGIGGGAVLTVLLLSTITLNFSSFLSLLKPTTTSQPD